MSFFGNFSFLDVAYIIPATNYIFSKKFGSLDWSK